MVCIYDASLLAFLVNSKPVFSYNKCQNQFFMGFWQFTETVAPKLSRKSKEELISEKEEIF